MNPKDYNDIKRMLYSEFLEQEPSEDAQKGFLTALAWFEQAITNPNIDEDLYDYLPIRIKYDNLKEQLKIVQGITERYEQAKKDYEGMKNTLENTYRLPKPELIKLKKEKEYSRMLEELKHLRTYKDLYYVMLVERYRSKTNNDM
ncbi:MAG: hypothetical protein IJZ44_06120 [Lachnospiraceae bacterium]|nr:hypothetical protein [Lachnospiraceae bacterium]